MADQEWVPIQASGIAYTLEATGSFGGEVSIVDSVLTSAGTIGGSDGSLTVTLDDDILPMRVTAIAYESSTVSGAETQDNFSFATDPSSTFVYNESAGEFGSTEWTPTPMEYECDVFSFEFGHGEQSGAFQFLIEVFVTPPEPDDGINCDCDCGYPTKTFAEMIDEVAIGMGYSAQLGRLSPSLLTLIKYHLNTQQRFVLQDLQEISSVRYFTWDVAVGQTKFCITDNLETCRKMLQASKISDVYVTYGGTIVEKLHKGIDFLLHAGGDPQSIPTRYEVRSCIEIWPPPSQTMTLVAKGELAAVQMVEDGDTPIANPDLIVMRTIAFMKAAKGHPDPANYMGQYRQSLGLLNGDQHMDMTYIHRGRECWRDDILTHVMQRRTYEGDLT